MSMPESLTCVVFGGSGFLGQRLSKTLVEQGHHVRSVSRTGRPRGDVQAWWAQVEWHSADLGTQNAAPALAGAELVFHLASSTYPSTSNTDSAFDLESNLIGSVRMLDSVLEYGVKRVVFVSSGGTVYGVPHQNPIPETHPTDPICSYGIHKLAVEKYLHLHRSLNHLDSIILRVSNLYGEYQRLDRPLGAVSHFIDRAFKGIPIDIWGDGSIRRDFVHVDDVVDALHRTITYRGPEYLFNIGSGRSVSLNELVQMIGRRLNRDIRVNYQPARSFDVHENVLDISRAANELGWKPAIRLEAGVDRMIASLL
jgi:UDP-glucose 4-epimerase